MADDEDRDSIARDSARISTITTIQKEQQKAKKRASYIGSSTVDAKEFEEMNAGNSVSWKTGTTCSKW
jgi:hypothetical protein